MAVPGARTVPPPRPPVGFDGKFSNRNYINTSADVGIAQLVCNTLTETFSKGAVSMDDIEPSIHLFLQHGVIHNRATKLTDSPLGACVTVTVTSELIDAVKSLRLSYYVNQTPPARPMNGLHNLMVTANVVTQIAIPQPPLCIDIPITKEVESFVRDAMREAKSIWLGGDKTQIMDKYIATDKPDPDPRFIVMREMMNRFVTSMVRDRSFAEASLTNGMNHQMFEFIMRCSNPIMQFPINPTAGMNFNTGDLVLNRIELDSALFGGVNKLPKIEKFEPHVAPQSAFIHTVLDIFEKYTDNTGCPDYKLPKISKTGKFTDVSGIWMVTKNAFNYMLTTRVVESVHDVNIRNEVTSLELSKDDMHPYSYFMPRHNVTLTIDGWTQHPFEKYEVNTQHDVGIIDYNNKTYVVTPMIEPCFTTKYLRDLGVNGISQYDGYVTTGTTFTFGPKNRVIPSIVYFTDCYNDVHSISMSMFLPFLEKLRDGLTTKLTSEEMKEFVPLCYPMLMIDKAKREFQFIEYLSDGPYYTIDVLVSNVISFIRSCGAVPTDDKDCVDIVINLQGNSYRLDYFIQVIGEYYPDLDHRSLELTVLKVDGIKMTELLPSSTSAPVYSLDVINPGFGLLWLKTHLMQTDVSVVCKPGAYGLLSSTPSVSKLGQFDDHTKNVLIRMKSGSTMYRNAFKHGSILVPDTYFVKDLTDRIERVIDLSKVHEMNAEFDQLNAARDVDVPVRVRSYRVPIIVPPFLPASMFETPNSPVGRVGSYLNTKQQFSELFFNKDVPDITANVFTKVKTFTNMKHNINTHMYKHFLRNESFILYKYLNFNPIAASYNILTEKNVLSVSPGSLGGMELSAIGVGGPQSSLYIGMNGDRRRSYANGVAYIETSWTGYTPPDMTEVAINTSVAPMKRKDTDGHFFPGYSTSLRKTLIGHRYFY